MSTRNVTRPVPEVVAFRYQPGSRDLLLFLAFKGKTFPMRIDLKWAGAGLYSYSPHYRLLMFSRGRKGKPATEGTVFMDHMANTAGHFTATRTMAEDLLALLWGERITLDAWPPDAVPQVIGVTLTDHAITLALHGHTPLRVPREGTGVWLSMGDPTGSPRVRRLSIQVQGREAITSLCVDMESPEGQAALTALGFLGYAPGEDVRSASDPLTANAAD